MSRPAMVLKKTIPKDTIRFYEYEVAACLEELDNEQMRRVLTHCYLPQEVKNQEEGNYRVNYLYSESIYVYVKIPECINSILVILTIDGELKVMCQKTINNEINVISWEESCQFMKYYNKSDLSFFTYAVKCACRFCYYPYSDCYTFNQWIKDKKINHTLMLE